MRRVVESTRLDVERERAAAVGERELRRVDRLFPASLQVCHCVLGRRLAAYRSNYELVDGLAEFAQAVEGARGGPRVGPAHPF